jgi:alkenylglycerophosphocholine/alkenylglycerophosphoethanolamine hydrolase
MSARDISAKWWLLTAYVVVGAANVLSTWFNASPWDTVTKTLLMPLLVGYVWTALRHPFGPGDRLIVVALFFSWLGDLALEPSGNLFFYLGLGMFALAQIAYLLAFNGIQGTRRPWPRWIAAPYAVWWLVLVVVLAPKMGILVIAVAIYGALLLGMAATSWRVSVTSGVGGLFFAISDSLIALTSLEKVIHLNHSGALIMLTYVFGQLLLVLGWCVPDEPAPKAVASS